MVGDRSNSLSFSQYCHRCINAWVEKGDFVVFCEQRQVQVEDRLVGLFGGVWVAENERGEGAVA